MTTNDLKVGTMFIPYGLTSLFRIVKVFTDAQTGKVIDLELEELYNNSGFKKVSPYDVDIPAWLRSEFFKRAKVVTPEEFTFMLLEG